jgi:hypothetical protein
MGLDYSYLLYFKRQKLWDVLQTVMEMSRPSSLPTLVVFPDHILPLSLKGWGEKERIVNFNEPQIDFTTSIYFHPDEEIKDYIKRNSPEHYETMSIESPLGIPIGCIYLTIYNDLRKFENKDWDPNLTLLNFGTPGTKMSVLFSESASIRNRFVELLETHDGICGILNMEDSAIVFWLNGYLFDKTIPDPYMTPEEIKSYLG